MKLTAMVTRSDGWWAIEVPEVPGLFTQAEDTKQIAPMVRDAAALLTGHTEDSFDVVLIPATAQACDSA